MGVDAARLIDEWEDARRGDEELSLEQFAARYGDEAEEARELLETLLRLTDLEPPSPMVDLLGARGASEGGEVVFAGWRILHELGQGGFGIVYAAEPADEPGGRLVALKLMNPLAFATVSRQAELLREAEVVERLSHPGIVDVVGYGTERGYAWLASELVEGVPLDALPPCEDTERAARAIEVGRQVCEAIAAAHASSVIHRDLKPSNVLLDEAGVAHVLDFGLARVGEERLSFSASDGLSGTPVYMAPEQLTGRGSIGPWTDLHALGLLLMILAEPRTSADLADKDHLLRRLAGRRAVSEAGLRRLPPQLRAVVARCLEVNPADRYPDATELAADLARLQQGLPPRNDRPRALQRGLRWARRRPLAALGLATILATPPLLVWELWWMSPVPVHVDSFLSGKHLHIDGRPVGVLPLTVNLRPGEHSYSLIHGSSQQGRTVFSGTLSVPNRRPSARVLMLDYWGETRFHAEGDQAAPIRIGPRDDTLEMSGASWALIAVRLGEPPHPSEARIQVDGLPGLDTQELPPVCSFRFPRGVHQLRITAPGHGTATLELRILDGEMPVAMVELPTLEEEQREDRWHTVCVSGPFDQQLKAGLHRLENLRPYVEYMRASAFDANMVHPNYYGLLEPDRPGVLGFWIDLPVEVTELDLETLHVKAWSVTSWTRLDVGPSPERLVPWVGFAHEEIPTGELPSDFPTPKPTDEARRLLTEAMGGHRRLYLRYTVAPAPTGDAYSYGRALFSQSLPLSDPQGTLVWRPALTIRVR